MSVGYLVPPAALFPARRAEEPAADGVTVPFGFGLSSRPGPVVDPIPTPEGLVYSPVSQVVVLDGHPAVTSKYGVWLLGKKAPTTEDSHPDTEELNK